MERCVVRELEAQLRGASIAGRLFNGSLRRGLRASSAAEGCNAMKLQQLRWLGVLGYPDYVHSINRCTAFAACLGMPPSELILEAAANPILRGLY